MTSIIHELKKKVTEEFSFFSVVGGNPNSVALIDRLTQWKHLSTFFTYVKFVRACLKKRSTYSERFQKLYEIPIFCIKRLTS